jgi:hypothetical protein
MVEEAKLSPAHACVVLNSSQSRAGDLGPLGFRADVDAFRRSIGQEHGSGADDALWPDLDVVAQRCIDSDETGFPDFDSAGNDDVRRDEAMIVNPRMVTDVVSAP